MHLKPSGSQNSLIDKVLSVGHADDNYIVECFHTVDICEQLVDNQIGSVYINQ